MVHISVVLSWLVHKSTIKMRERVCDYPRPPRLVKSCENIRVDALGITLAQTKLSLRVLETFHPPTYYLPPNSVNKKYLKETSGRPSYCEWKGIASYYDIVVHDKCVKRAVWTYPNPTGVFRELAGWYAVYPGLMDNIWVNGEVVVPQPGRFYGGWITSRVEGPFKGDPNHPELV